MKTADGGASFQTLFNQSTDFYFVSTLAGCASTRSTLTSGCRMGSNSPMSSMAGLSGRATTVQTMLPLCTTLLTEVSLTADVGLVGVACLRSTTGKTWDIQLSVPHGGLVGLLEASSGVHSHGCVCSLASTCTTRCMAGLMVACSRRLVCCAAASSRKGSC
jgi:hypothetical protein